MIEQPDDYSDNYAPERSLQISPLPKTINKEELELFMREFGTIRNLKWTLNSLWIEYIEKETVDILFKRSESWLPNEILFLKRIRQTMDEDNAKNKTRKKKETKKVKEVESEMTKLKKNSVDRHLIRDIQEFQDEMRTLFKMIQFTFELKMKYDIVYDHLQRMIWNIFPQCILHRTGSTMMGLALRNSDLNLIIYTSNINRWPLHKKWKLESRKIINTILYKLKIFMHKQSDISSHIIMNTKIPRLTFRYLPANVFCHLSLENNLSIYRTKFLKFCRSFDDRVKSLMILLKYWADVYEITGIEDKICSYALMCVIIFYLQGIGILPTIIQLRKDCTIPMIVNGWQVNFNENYKQTKSSGNEDLSIADLLYGFFKFVTDIFPNKNFGEQYYKGRYKILSLLDGKIYSIEEFDKFQLPQYMNSYIQYVQTSGSKFNAKQIVSIQDPIDFSHNAMNANSYLVLENFHTQCYNAACLIEKCKSTNDRYLLKNLLSNVQKPLKEKICVRNFLNIRLPPNFLTQDILNEQQFRIDNIYYIVFNLLKNILEIILMCKVNIDNIKISKSENLFPHILSKKLVKNNKEIHFHCETKKRVWKNREEHYHILLNKDLSRLEQEIIISERVMKKLIDENEDDFILKFTFIARKFPDTIDITVCTDDDPWTILQEFHSVLHSWIPKIIKMTIGHMLRCNKTYTQLRNH